MGDHVCAALATMKFSLYWHFFSTVVFSVIYFIFPNAGTKIIPVVMLSIFSIAEGHRYSKYVSTGLIFSALGDISLQLEDGNFLIFLAGVISFLIAHCFYITAYISTTIDFEFKVATGVTYFSYYIALMVILIPHLDPVMIPAIIIYGGVICSMAFLATNRYFTVEIDSLSRTTALVGSLFFLASDTTLSLHLFRTSVPYANIIIMVTYYIGQMFIAMSTKDPYHEGEEDLTNYYRETASPLLA